MVDTDEKIVKPSAPMDSPPPVDITLIQKERNKKIINDIKTLEDKLNHYNKVRRKWSKAKTSFDIISILIGSSATIVTVVSTAGILAIPLYITSLVALSGVTETILIQSLSLSIFSQKKKLYQNISNEIKSTISKLYIFHQKALDDGFIDNDEIQQIEKIINDMDANIKKVKNQNSIKFETNQLNKEDINKLKELLNRT